ncbi:MAG: oligosaccharide flippase family protein [Saprospiraceae bacterium]
MSLRRLAKETVIYGGSTVLNKVLNLILVAPYLTRVFEDDQGEYGIHGLMYAFAGFLLVILTYGMETAFFRFGNDEAQRAKVFSTAAISLVVSTFTFVGLIILFSSSIAGFLTQPGDWLYVVYFGLIIGLDTLVAIPFASLRLENRPLRFGFYKMVNVLVNALVMLLLLEVVPRLMSQEEGLGSWYDPNKKLHYVFIANLVASILTFLLFLPYYRKLKGGFDLALWRKMIAYALPLVIVGVAGMINQLADRYFLKEWLPGTFEENKVQLGIYVACIKIAVLMNLFTQGFKFAAEPFFFRNADRANATTIYAQVGQAFTLVGSLAFLGLMLYIDIAKHLIASSYHSGLAIVPVLLMAYLLLGLYYNFAIWYKLKDKTYIGAWIACAGAIITILGNYYLIPRIGLMGAAWSALICFISMCIACYLTGRKYYPIPYPLGRMGAYLGLALAIFWLSDWLRPQLPSLPFRLLVNTGLLLLYLGSIGILEKNGLLKMILKRK